MNWVWTVVFAVVAVGVGIKALETGRDPEKVSNIVAARARTPLLRTNDRSVARGYRASGVAAMAMGLWTLVSSILFHGRTMSWTAVFTSVALVVGFVLFVTRRLKLR